MDKKNNSKEKEYVVFKGVDKEALDEMYKLAMTKFATSFIKEDASPKTRPSVIALGGTKEIKLDRLSPEDIERYLWMHPIVPRGIEIKANRMIRRGYSIKPSSESEEAKEAAKEMKTLFENSGGIIRIKKWIEDAFAYGNGFMTLVPNTDGDKIVRLNPEHPIFFRIAKDPKKRQNVAYTSKGDLAEAYEGEMKIDPATKLPTSFIQVIFDYNSKKFKPIGEELDASQVAHLVFDTWGDEVEGISLVQYLYLTIKYLLNIEEAAAETLHKAGFTQKKITTEIMTERDLKKIAKNLQQINAKDAIILPKGANVENLYPGTSQFAEFHKVFIQLIAIRLGIPQPLLTMDATTTNKSTIDAQMVDMAADFRADEIKVKQVIEDQIFVPACKLLYGEDFEEFPEFEFNPLADEKADKINQINLLSQTHVREANAISRLVEAGFTEQAQKLADFLTRECFLEDEEL